MQCDLDHLTKLLRGDHRLVKEWVLLYLQESPRYFEQLVSAQHNGDAEALTHAAHDLQPQARYLNNERMLSLLTRIEENATVNDVVACSIPLNELGVLRGEVEAELRAFLGPIQQREQVKTRAIDPARGFTFPP